MNPSEGEGNGAEGKVLLSFYKDSPTSAASPKQRPPRMARGSRTSHSLESLESLESLAPVSFRKDPGHLYRVGT